MNILLFALCMVWGVISGYLYKDTFTKVAAAIGGVFIMTSLFKLAGLA